MIFWIFEKVLCLKSCGFVEIGFLRRIFYFFLRVLWYTEPKEERNAGRGGMYFFFSLKEKFGGCVGKEEEGDGCRGGEKKKKKNFTSDYVRKIKQLFEPSTERRIVRTECH